MADRIKKYNPAFLSPEELVRSFVVRHIELELIVRVIRENVAESNQHVLVVGPRGIGKTMLVLRIVEEIRKEKDLRKCWYPLVFSEESYQVSTPGEFWLEALFHLAHQTKEEQWMRTYEELRDERDEERLRERALAQLMDFADAEAKRILLVVENFNMLLGEQISDSDAWKLRHTLLHEPRIMLLATATSRFEEIDNTDKAMFELFKLYELGPLEEEDCGKLWKSIAGKETSDERVRPLQILTGGNPRLLAIISTFAAKMSLRELMDDLMQLVDDHTEYFKVHLDNLPAVERKVYLALAELWDPVRARKVADFARLNVNKASSLLRRLVERGMVVEANGQGRTKLYEVSERMYNIYYLMRRRGAPSRRVKGLVRFMVPFYGPKDLVSLTQRIAEEACKLEPGLRREYFWAYEGMVKSTSTNGLRKRLLQATPPDFFGMPDTPASIKYMVEREKGKEADGLKSEVLELLKQGKDLEKAEKLEKAERVYRRASEVAPQQGETWIVLGRFLGEKLGKYEEAEKTYRRAIEVEPDSAQAWGYLGELLHWDLNRYEEAEKAYRKAIEIDEKFAWSWANLGLLMHDTFGQYEEAEAAYRKSIQIDGRDSWDWIQLARLLCWHFNRWEEGEESCRKAIELAPADDLAWAVLAKILWKTRRYEEAEAACRKIIQINPEDALALRRLGMLLERFANRREEAEKVYRRALELKSDDPCCWYALIDLLDRRLGCYEEAAEMCRKAIEACKELDDQNDVVYIWGELIFLLLDKLGLPEEGLKLTEECLARYRKNPHFLNVLAWAFCRHGGRDYLARAEALAKEALELAPEHQGIRGTLTSILSARSKGKEALEHLDKFLSDPGLVARYVEEAIEQFVGIAAAGYGREALKILAESESAEILEPLVVGLRMYVGEDVKAAAEIMEVGKDVVKRIEQRKKEMQKKKKGGSKKKRRVQLP